MSTLIDLRNWDCNTCQELEEDVRKAEPSNCIIVRTKQAELLDLHRLRKHSEQMFYMYYGDKHYLKQQLLDWWNKRAQDIMIKLGM